MGSFTRVQLEGRLQNYLNNPTYYTPTDFIDSIQDGLDELAAFTGCIYANAVVPFVQNKTYYDMLGLLPDYIGAVAIWNAVIRRWLIPTSLTKLNASRWDWECAGGTPFWFTPINHRYIAIYQKPVSASYGNMYVFYRAAAPQLNDQTPIPVPNDHIQALESYVLTDLWEQNQEFSKASQYFQNSYIPDLDKLRVYIQQMRNPDRQIRLMP